MTVSTQSPQKSSPIGWLSHQPYLLLSLMALFWAGNIVLGRFVTGHVPPFSLTFVRWFGTFLVLLPFAWPHLTRDWNTIRRHLPLLAVLAFTGFALNNAVSYWGLQHTQAINALLIQSSGPLFVALWSLILFGIRLTAAQTVGIAISMIGVLIIILRGDISSLFGLQFNIGDIMFATALFIFGLYSALMPRRPKIHALSLLAFTTGCGSLMLIPTVVWEVWHGSRLTFDPLTIATIVYVVIFPSSLAYLFFNRAIELIGPNRAAPFFHLVPVFGSVMAIAFLGEVLHPFHIVGYAMVLAGVYIASRQRSAVPTTPMGEAL